MTRFDTDPYFVRANAARAAPGSHASHHAASGVDGPPGFGPISQVMEVLTRDQERRWSHLIEFAQSSRRARAAEKAAGDDQ